MKETQLDIGFSQSKTPLQFAAKYCDEIIHVMQRFDIAAVGEFIAILEDVRSADGTIYFCGNGGKAALCSEFVNDLTVALPRKPFRAQSLMDNVTALTAAANDYDYEMAVTRILAPMLRAGDLVVALSGSGNSANVINAVQCATRFKVVSVGIGRGGILKNYVDLHIPINCEDDGPTEDATMMILHMVHHWFIRYDVQ